MVTVPWTPHPNEMVTGPILCKFCADNHSYKRMHGHVMSRGVFLLHSSCPLAVTSFCPSYVHWALRWRGAECSTNTYSWLFVYIHSVSIFRIFIFLLSLLFLYYLTLHFSVTSAYCSFWCLSLGIVLCLIIKTQKTRGTHLLQLSRLENTPWCM